MDRTSLNNFININEIIVKLFCQVLPMVDFPPHHSGQSKVFSPLTSFLILIFHKYVLFIKFKLIQKVCNLNTTGNLV